MLQLVVVREHFTAAIMMVSTGQMKNNGKLLQCQASYVAYFLSAYWAFIVNFVSAGITESMPTRTLHKKRNKRVLDLLNIKAPTMTLDCHRITSCLKYI